jgi:hypothetical protein
VFPKIFVLIVLLGIDARSDELSADLRYTASSALRNTCEVTGDYTHSSFPWLGFDFAARVATSVQDLDRLEYKAEARFPLLSFFTPSVRLLHLYRFNESVAASTLLVTLETSWRFAPSLRVFASVAWYERFTLLSEALIVPTLPRNHVHDHDLGTVFGIEGDPVDSWRVIVKAGTYEELEVYNLNNPYLGVDLVYHPQAEHWNAMLFARYRVFLGFGRLDAFTFGFGMKWEITEEPSAGSCRILPLLTPVRRNNRGQDSCAFPHHRPQLRK